MRFITFVTGNPAKAEELEHHLQSRITHESVEVPEIRSLDLREVVTRKASAAYEYTPDLTLVEDTPLVFSALGKLPGQPQLLEGGSRAATTQLQPSFLLKGI